MIKHFSLIFLVACLISFLPGIAGAGAGKDSTDVNINTGAIEAEKESGVTCNFTGEIKLRTQELDKQTSICSYCRNCSPSYLTCSQPARSGVHRCPEYLSGSAFLKTQICEKRQIRKDYVKCENSSFEEVKTSTAWTSWNCRCDTSMSFWYLINY